MGGKGKSRMKTTKVKGLAGEHSDSVECGCGTSEYHGRNRPARNPHEGGRNGSQKKMSSIVPLPLCEFPLAISISELIVGEFHKDRVLTGTFCVEPFFINCVHTVLEDKFGNTVRVLIDDDGVSVFRQNSKALSRYAKGNNVHISDPYYKVCVDGGTAVRVDDSKVRVDGGTIVQLGDVVVNPSDLFEEDITNSKTNDVSLKPEIKSCKLGWVDGLRGEGNQLFAKQDWTGAVGLYSKCISESLRLHECAKVDGGISANDVKEYSKFNETMLLAYSNRSETWLRLRKFDEALSDANKALELDGKHVKSLVRKGKALQELQLFEESAACFSAALQHSPDDPSIQGALARSKTSHQQSRDGIFNLSGYYLGGCEEHVPPCSDYVGDVAIKRLGSGGRGLFASRDFPAGELLLVSNAVAVCQRDRSSGADADGCGACEACEYHLEFGRRNSRYMDDLIGQLKVFASSSKRRMHQISALAGAIGSKNLVIPSVDLFRPGSKWTPSSSCNLQLDSENGREILRQNCIDETPNDLTHLITGKSEQTLSGLWLLPSLMNHSCCANTETWLVGNALFIYACRAISSDEELTRSYFDTLKGLERRQESSKRWSFKCSCERCEWESNIPEPQNKIRKKLCNRVHRFFFEAYAAVYPPNMEKLAGVVASVEETIKSVGLEGRFRHWIRASLMDAYIADVHVLVGIPTRRIEAIKRVLGAMTAVGGGLSMRLQIAATLMREVERKHGKASPVFRKTEAYVMQLYRPLCGELSRKTFSALAKMHSSEDGLM